MIRKLLLLLVAVVSASASEQSKLQSQADAWGSRLGFEKVSVALVDRIDSGVWGHGFTVPGRRVVFVIVLSSKGYRQRNPDLKLVDIKTDQVDTVVHELVHSRFRLGDEDEDIVVELTRILRRVRKK